MSDFAKMTYVVLNEQVTLQNQDPVKIKAGLKPSLIDLETYGVSYGDKGQEFIVQAERLNEKGLKLTETCESLISYRKYEREIRRGFPAKPFMLGHESNRLFK